ncbi:MAG: hypothetical protein ACM3NJ_00460 [Methanobacterium sp.]
MLSACFAGCSEKSQKTQGNIYGGNEVAEYCINQPEYTYWYKLAEKDFNERNRFYQTNKEGSNSYYVQDISESYLPPEIAGFEEHHIIYQIKEDTVTATVASDNNQELKTINGSFRPLILKTNAEWTDEYKVEKENEAAITVKRQCKNIAKPGIYNVK